MFIPIKKHRRSGVFLTESVCVMSAVSTMRMVSAMSLMSTAVTMLMLLMTAAMPVRMILAVLMLVAMRTLALICAALKCPCEMLCDTFIRIPLHAGYEFNARLRESRLCARADAAADHNVRFRTVEETRECAMPLADRVHNLRGLYRAVLDIIELKLFCPAEVLLNRLIFIGYCDSHHILSFVLNLRHNRVLDPIRAACNADALPADDCLRELVACRLIDTRYRRAGHAHRGGTFLLRLPPVVDLSDRLKLIQLEDNGLLRLLLRILRRKTPKIGINADAPASLWSRHNSSISVI